MRYVKLVTSGLLTWRICPGCSVLPKETAA
jgi:hypothetical protein